MGLTAQWTTAAAAREYHESLAIEAMIRDNPEAREAWLRRRLQLECEDPFVSDEEPTTETPVHAAEAAFPLPAAVMLATNRATSIDARTAPRGARAGPLGQVDGTHSNSSVNPEAMIER